MTTKTPVLVSEIYKSRKNILDIMESNGYNTYDYSNFSINEVNAMNQNNQLDMLLERRQNTNVKFGEIIKVNKLYIRYYLGKKISNNNIQDIIDDLFVLSDTLTKDDTLFIIIKDDVNDSTIARIKHIWDSEGIYIVVESIYRLQFNILNHILVPKHIIITDDEANDVFKRYNIKSITEMPEISRFDPVARVICIRPQQICKIIRPSKTAIETEYYRVCV